MKRFSLILMVLCTAAWMAGCNKDKDPDFNAIVIMDGSLNDGSIIIDGDFLQKQDINNNPNPNNEELTPAPTTKSAVGVKMGVKASEETNGLKANDYRFKLVAEMNTLKLSDGYEVQATDVKITDPDNSGNGFAFVSYNDEGVEHRGGAVVYKYKITPGSFATANVEVEKVTSLHTPKAEFSAIEFNKDNNKLYLVGASEEPKFGYTDEGGLSKWNYAFLLVMELNADKTFKSVKPKIVKLTSFQATSLRVTPQRIYITTGDGTGGTKGGLYILSASDYSLVKFVEGKENARSVAVEGSNVFLMQAMSAKVTKFDVTGGNEDAIYPKVYDVDLEGNENNYTYENEAMQEAARSDMIAWNNLLFVSMNESGLRMLKNDGTVGQTIERPGPDKDKHVTNSVSMNTDKKKDANGKEVQSNLLLLANGEKGIYWYDVVKDTYGNDRIVASAANSVLAAAGKSANFISSKGNVVFVANGLGGLKVLYIGFEEAPVKETCPPGGVFKHQTFIKDNGNSKFPPPALPLDRKVGEVLIQDEGDYLVIYLWPTVPNLKLNNAGIFFGPNLEWLDAYKDGNQGVFLGSGAPKDKNVGNGFMKDRNKDYRTIYSDGSVRFAFPKDFVKDFIDPVTGELLIIVYSGNGAWGYGIPNGPSGVTGTGVNNNGQIIVLKGVGFCK